MNNLPNTHALWQLTGKLFELGVEMNLNEERLKLQYRSGYPVFGYALHDTSKLLDLADRIQASMGSISTANILRILYTLSQRSRQSILRQC